MYQFKVEKMNCMGCFHNIEDALKEFDSKITARADVKNQLVIVEASQPAAELSKVIETAGYPVLSVTQG